MAATLVVASLATRGVAVGAMPIQDDPDLERRVDTLIHDVVRYLYEGRLDLADESIRKAESIAPADPRVGLYRFRLMRENFPDNVDERDRARERVPALIEELERVIAQCNDLLATRGEQAAFYMYRGWAEMMKAQVYAIAREFRSAAFASRAGKNDFDKFYELHPAGDPDASTVMGGFLYFADVLPGIVKFIRWLIRVPGGDRERGLELLAEGAGGGGYTHRDAQMVRAFIFYLFEGRIEDAKQILGDLADAYPRNPRVIELYASSVYRFPDAPTPIIDRLNTIIDGWGAAPRGWDDLFLHRLRFSRARLLLEHGWVDDAVVEFADLGRHGTDNPAWLRPLSLLNAIATEQQIGATAAADSLCVVAAATECEGEEREALDDVCERPQSSSPGLYRALQTVRRTLYEGDTQRALAMLEPLLVEHPADIRLQFVQGDALRQSDRLLEARTAFQQVADSVERQHEAIGWRLAATMRIGEVSIDLDRVDDAERAYKQAADLQSGSTTLGTMIRGRLRFIEALSN